jgi:hypothetical protein
MSENDKDSKKLQEKKPADGGEMKKVDAAKGGKDNKKDPKAPKEEELVRTKTSLYLL